MFDITPAVRSDLARPTDQGVDSTVSLTSTRLTAVSTHPDLDGPVAARRSLDWSDLPTGAGRLSEVRRRLRVLQVQRAGSGRGLAA